jgi:glyoxylase-like metal-dependent hydrolase (beta-lactamase superfamily II)
MTAPLGTQVLAIPLHDTATCPARNAWVLNQADDFIVVDPGHPSQSGDLLSQLAHAGLQPRRCTHVFLTDVSWEAAGNVGEFINAVVVSSLAAATPAGFQSALELRRAQDSAWCDRFRGLDDTPKAWVEQPCASLISPPPALTRLHFVHAGSAPTFTTPVGPVAGVPAPGVSDMSMVWMSEEGTLFGGESCNLDVEPQVRNMDAYLDTLLQVTRLTPQRICPAAGNVHTSPTNAFRSLSLFANNLMSNIQYALDGPRTVAELRYRDWGFWPDHVREFAAACRTLESALSALHQAGVATIEERPSGLTRYFIDRPARY